MPKLIDNEILLKLLNKEWLHNRHVIEKMSIVELALELHITAATVRKHIRNHGIESPSQQELREASNIRKHGVPNTGALPSSRKKALTTMQARFGGHNWSRENRSKRDNTCLERYGNVNVAKTLHGIEKARQTNNKRYNRDHSNHLHSLRFFQHSMAEKDIIKFLKNSIPEIEIVENSRSIIAPKELDIYLPEYRLAIEYCGLYWHSEHRGKDRHYHLNKLNNCNNQNIRLLTIFEDEWLHHPRIVKNTILTILHRINTESNFARKCDIVSLSSKEKKLFFDDTHIQGTGPGSITYGLQYQNKLVAAMTFIKKQYDIFVLNRYASSANVVGGFSKLLTHFERNHNWLAIESFADRRWSEGNVYIKNGFTQTKVLKPDYRYIVGGDRLHKFGFRHHQLTHKIAQYDPMLTEEKNCEVAGIAKIWDCGLIKYVKLKNNS